ncbi:MAG: radical SAM protein [Microscillaceae bacterium]|jgi:MoaA/NifB/PqqE/SkfB family radical SAM enzyme|nr:radical SAM protein [Microscillaceae bacterium]
MRLIKKPVLCNYYVTYRCNASCEFCDIWERPSPYITLENAEKNFRDLKKLGVKVIDFTGGEPLLHRQISELLTLAKEFKFITTLTTNGLLYPKLADKLQGKVDMLHFSLDSPIREQHDAGRGVKCFDFVMQSIQIARDLGEKPDILFTIFEENIDQIAQMYEEIILPNRLVLILNPVFDYNAVKTGKGLSISTLRELSAWGKKKNVYLNEAFIALRLDGGNHIDKPVCKAGSSTIVISPENKLVLPCYHLGLEEIPIEDDLYNLYQSPQVQQLIALEGRLPACEGCVINCYMQPSFAVEINKYFWRALPSTLKYNLMKGTWKQLIA